jgi:hypothetical protein
VATFDEKHLVDQLIKNEGWLDDCLDGRDAPDNPPAVRIVEYKNFEGRTTWGVVFQGERDINKYERPTEYVNEPRVIWQRAT